MFTEIIKQLTDVFYFSFVSLGNFRKSYPAEKVVAYGASKGLEYNEDQKITYEAKWMVSRRGTLILSDKRLKFGDWDFELGGIQKAEMVDIRGGYALKINTKSGRFFHFGLMKSKIWKDQNVLNIEFINEEIKYTTFSIMMRILRIFVLIMLVIYILAACLWLF